MIVIKFKLEFSGNFDMINYWPNVVTKVVAMESRASHFPFSTIFYKCLMLSYPAEIGIWCSDSHQV